MTCQFYSTYKMISLIRLTSGNNSTRFAVGAMSFDFSHFLADSLSFNSDDSLSMHKSLGWIINSRPGNGHSELFLDEIDTNEDLPWNMDMVDSGLENAERKFLTRVHDHHTIMSIAEDVEFIFKVSEEKSTLIASLDVGLKCGFM